MRSSFIPCLASCVLAISATASAQSSQTTQPPVITEKVEVVATRLPEAPHDVPASIEVLTGEELRNLGATTLREALSLSTGVEIAPGGDAGPAGAVPEFWGLREFDAFLLVVDDVPWGGAFNPALTTLSLRDVERVEILRGAAPVTYGATSFVGVIHVVHTAASAARSYATAHGGSYGSGGVAADFAVRTGAGWNSRLTADFDRQGFADDRTSYSRGHALWRSARIESDRRTWFTADVNFLRQSPASPHPRQGPSLSSAVPLDANHNPADAFIDEDRFAVNYGMERPVLSTARLGVIASYTRTNRRLFRGFLRDVADGPDNAAGLRQDIGINDIYADVHLAWPSLKNVRIVTGADFLHGSGESSGATFDYTAPLSGAIAAVVTEPTVLDLKSEDRREFFGGYALAEWSPVSRLHLSAGARVNVTSEEREEAGEVEPAGGDEAQTHVRPSGSVGALVNAWESGINHVRLFANVRSTFKPAAFDFGLGEGEGEEGGLLDPETAYSIEGGVKVRALEGRVDLETSVFRMNFSNLVTATVVDGLPALMNSGKTRFQGVEIASDLRLPYHVNGRASYSFHDATFVDFVQAFDGVPTQLAGKRLEMSARHLVSAGLSVAPTTGWIGSFVIKHSGDRFLTKRNTAKAEPFTTVDLGVGYRFDRYELRVDGRNITDRRDPVAESELGDGQYYRMFPREWRAGIGVRF